MSDAEPGHDHRDLRLQPGERWHTVRDVLAGCPDGGDIEEFLRSKGWQPFLTLGDTDDGVSLMAWQRSFADRTDVYLLQVAGPSLATALPPYLTFHNLPDLLDALSRWAPLVQASVVTSTLLALRDELDDHGLVETIAARVAHGVQYTLPNLQRAVGR